MKINMSALGAVAFSGAGMDFQQALWRKYVAQDRREITACLEALCGSGETALAAKAIFFDANAAPVVQAITREIREELQHQQCPIEPFASSDDYEVVIRMLSETEMLLQSTDAFAARAVQMYIKTLVILSCPDFTAASSAKFLGVVVMSPKRDWQVTDYIENIVHEASHIDLFIRQIIDPLVVSKTYIASPYRALPRPAIGVFHAAFVLSRICLVLHQLLIQRVYADRVEMQLHINREKLIAALESLRSNIELTPLGRCIFNNMCRVRDALLAPVPGGRYACA